MYDITPGDIEFAKRVVLAMPVAHSFGAEDAIGDGLLGLVKAARSFDGQGDFRGWAYWRIVGEVRDAARRADHLRRAHRRAVKAGDCEDVPPAMHLEALSHWDWESIFGCEDEDLALRITLDDAINTIEGWAGAALRMVLLQDLAQVEVAQFLGVSESRVSQLLRDARAELRAALGARSAAEILG